MEEFRFKLRGKVGIRPIGRINALDEIQNAFVAANAPIVPKPGAAPSGHREDAPMEEDTDFRLVVPVRVGY